MFRRFILPSSLAVLLGLAYAWHVASQSPGAARPPSSSALQKKYEEAKAAYQHSPIQANKVQYVAVLKEKYPVQSLAERLAYEQAHADVEPPPLLDVARAELARLEGQAMFTNRRAEALRQLHTLEVETFAARLGAGVSRIVRPNEIYERNLEPPRREPVEFVQLPPLSTEAATGVATTALGGEAAESAQTPLAWLPTRTELRRMHYDGVSDFASPSTFGWVQSVDRVAGFMPHSFSKLPQAPLDVAAAKRARAPAAATKKSEEPPRWKIVRLELMSLFKHQVPRVYLSEQLPTMEELSAQNAKTRGLDEFETAAVEKIRRGDDVQTLSTLNRIQMLGAVRTTKMCLQCHDIPDGTLLGGFSYEFRRDPPIPLTSSPSPLVQ